MTDLDRMELEEAIHDLHQAKRKFSLLNPEHLDWVEALFLKHINADLAQAARFAEKLK